MTPENDVADDALQGLAPDAVSPSVASLSAELRDARLALENTQRELQAVLSVVTDLVIVLDDQGRYLEIRNSPQTLLPRAPEAIVGKTLHDVLPPMLADLSLRAVQESLRRHQRVTLEYSLDLARRTWFEAHVFPIDEHRVLSLVRDITERKRAEVEIGRYAERLRILHEIDQSILAARSPAAIALAALGRLRRMLACQRVTAVEFGAGEHVSVLGVEAEHEFSTAMQSCAALLNQEALRQGRPQGVEDLAALAQRTQLQELLFHDGMRAYVAIPMLVHTELIGALLLEAAQPHVFTAETIDAALEVAALLAIAIRQARLYVMAEQRAEQLAQATQLAQEALANAEAANHAKSAFLANMTHELRTPLNVILGFVQLMAQHPRLDAEQRENLAIIGRSGEHLLDLINNVLELSKIEAGRIPLQEQDFDLHQLLYTLEEMFTPRAARQKLHLIFQWSRDIPRYIHLDQGKLRQILINLLDNAIKFTQEGSVILRVAATANAPGAEYGFLRFEVEDTGPGIAPEERARVFTPFVQAGALPHGMPGTGLGLAISQQLARLLGAEITLRSQVGAGCLFAFDLRYTLADASIGPHLQLGTTAPEILKAKPGQPTYRVLLADDEELSRRLLVKMLTPLGLELREAADGAETLRLWETWQPHLIFMDIRMPVMDGHELVRRIRATAGGQETVIIALTAVAFEEERIALLNEGCDDFMRKPFLKTEIHEKLAQHLGLQFLDEEPLPATLPVDSVSVAEAPAVSPQMLHDLPEAWRDALREATINAEVQRILECIEQIGATHPSLASALKHLADDYDHDTILMLLSPNLEA